MPSIFESLLGIALEEDITSQVQSTTQSVLGKGSTTSGFRRNPAGFDGKRDMNQVDDIFGTEGDDDQENPEDQGDENQDNPGDDTGTDDMGEDGGSEDPNLEEDQTTDQPKDESNPIYKKNKLRDNMILFHGILSNNIELLSDSMTSVNDPALLQTCNDVARNLREAKQALFAEIEGGLQDHSYEESLTKYVALRRVYDLSIEMLDKHFGNTMSKPGKGELKKGKK